MRSLILAAAATALIAAPATAEPQRGGRPGMSMPRPGGHMPRPGMHMPRPGGHMTMPRPGGGHGWRHPGMRWGHKVGGRWWAGGRAPGGWGGYRTPYIGWSLPSYWIAPSYYVTNWAGYGLPMAPDGYYWSRYYDDAVMIDRYGRVRDHRAGLDWDRFDNGEYSIETWVDGRLVERHEMDGSYGYDDADRGPPPPPPPMGRQRKKGDGAVTGAVVGGVLGGVAGNVIAGRGNRAAGTILGAGAGAIAGAAIGGAGDRRRSDREPPVAPYGAPYPPPGHAEMDHDGPPADVLVENGPGMHREKRVIVKRDGDRREMTFDTGAHGGKPYTTVVRSPGAITTVTVIPGTTTTTTTTSEYVLATPTYRKTVKRSYRPKVKSKLCHCR